MNENQIPTWELLTAYFDGELDRGQRLEMEQLLFENPEYVRALQQWKEMRAELQAIPSHSLTGGTRRNDELSRNVMDRIFESVAAGEIEWDSRPVDLDAYYKLQQSGAATTETGAGWGKDFRTLHPEQRMRRWRMQLGALASVAALLMISLVVSQWPNGQHLTAERAEGESVGRGEGEGILEHSLANSPLSMKSAAGSLGVDLEPSGAIKPSALPAGDASMADAGMTAAKGAPDGVNFKGADFKGADGVASQSLDNELEANIRLHQGESGDSAVRMDSQIAMDAQIPEEGGFDSLQPPTLVEGNTETVQQSVGVVIVEADDFPAAMEKWNSVLTANGFQAYNHSPEVEESTVRLMADSGKIAEVLYAMKKSGAHLTYHSAIPEVELTDDPVLVESVHSAGISSKSPVLGQQVETMQNKIPEDLKSAVALQEMFDRTNQIYQQRNPMQRQPFRTQQMQANSLQTPQVGSRQADSQQARSQFEVTETGDSEAPVEQVSESNRVSLMVYLRKRDHSSDSAPSQSSPPAAKSEGSK